jgi:cysteine desulfurase
VLRAAEAFQRSGGDVEVLPVGEDGRLDPAEVEARLRGTSGPVIVSVQAANSETGVVQPLAEIATLLNNREDALFHSDAAQAYGKMHLVLGGGRGPDVLSVSGHKLHAPMGVGALLLHKGETRLSPLLRGGDQEGGRRAGTQSLPLIAGFGAACRERRAGFAGQVERMRRLRNQLEAGVRAALPSVQVNGESGPRLPNTSNLLFPSVDAMALVATLDAEGVLASQGSACHSRRPEPSSVLTAMGLCEADAYSSVRFSVSPLNTEAEIEAAIAIIVSACRRLGIRR